MQFDLEKFWGSQLSFAAWPTWNFNFFLSLNMLVTLSHSPSILFTYQHVYHSTTPLLSLDSILLLGIPSSGVVSYSSMSREHTRDRAGDQLGLGRLHAHVCRIITSLSESTRIVSESPISIW